MSITGERGRWSDHGNDNADEEERVESCYT